VKGYTQTNTRIFSFNTQSTPSLTVLAPRRESYSQVN